MAVEGAPAQISNLAPVSFFVNSAAMRRLRHGHNDFRKQVDFRDLPRILFADESVRWGAVNAGTGRPPNSVADVASEHAVGGVTHALPTDHASIASG